MQLAASLHAALLLFAASACGDAAKGPAAPAQARHLLIVTIDTLRADRLGCYGNARGLTPAMDRIASEGTRFANAMAPMPATLPSHAALFTGLSPRRSGVASNFRRASPELDTLAEELSAAGFATAAFFNQFNFDQANLVQGFQVFANDPTERAEKVVGNFESWLAKHRQEAHLFCWIHLFLPHGPLDVPDEFLKRLVQHAYSGPLRDDFQTMEKIRKGSIPWSEEFAANYRDRYDAAVAFADAKLALVRAVLEREALLDQTLLVVVADHGESLEQGVLGLHSPVIRESTLHVPLLLRGPGIPLGRTVPDIVQHMDLFPTLLALLGREPPADREGRDLRPLLHGDAAEPAELAESADPGAAIALLPVAFDGKREGGVDPEQAAVRRGRFKLVMKEGGKRELFDVEADPAEAHDLAAGQPEVVRALDAAFTAWTRSAVAATEAGAVSAEMQEQLKKLGYQ